MYQNWSEHQNYIYVYIERDFSFPMSTFNSNGISTLWQQNKKNVETHNMLPKDKVLYI